MRTPLIVAAICTATVAVLLGIYNWIGKDEIAHKKLASHSAKMTDVADVEMDGEELGYDRKITKPNSAPSLFRHKKAAQHFDSERGDFKSQVANRSTEDLEKEMNNLSDFLEKSGLSERFSSKDASEKDRQEARDVLRRLSMLGMEIHERKSSEFHGGAKGELQEADLERLLTQEDLMDEDDDDDEDDFEE